MANEAKNDGIGKTLLVVLLLCLVCSVVVAGSAVGLKSKQQEQKLLDKQRNILDVAGLLQPKMESEQVKRLYSERIEPRLVDLNSGEFVAGKAAAFDLGAALRDDAKSVALDNDGNTVKGITYYDQGETPGLGGEVENPSWRQQWVGKQLFDDNGQPVPLFLLTFLQCG